MLGLIISILLFGTDITNNFAMLTYDCENSWSEQFLNINDCLALKEYAWLWFKYFMAMNILGSLDVGAYLVLLNYASNPFIEKNKSFIVLLSDKCHFRVLPHNIKNAFIYKRNFYYLREPFIDTKTNNKFYIYYEGISEPIHDISLAKPKITTMLATTHLDLKTKTLRQYLKMFRPSFWHRHYILILKPDMTAEVVEGKGEGIPYKFGLFRKLWINLQRKTQDNEKEIEVTGNSSKLLTTTTLVPTTIAIEKVPNALNANFNYMVYKDYIDLYKKLSGKEFPIWLLILAIVGIAIIALYMAGIFPTSSSTPPAQPPTVMENANGTG